MRGSYLRFISNRNVIIINRKSGTKFIIHDLFFQFISYMNNNILTFFYSLNIFL